MIASDVTNTTTEVPAAVAAPHGNRRALARTLGISEGAIRKAERDGRITRPPDGMYDLARVRAEWAAATDPTRAASAMLTADQRIATHAESAPSRSEKESDDKAMNLGEARLKRELLAIERQSFELQKLRGELVHLRVMQQVVGNAATTIRERWLNWPARAAGHLATELGVDRMTLEIALERLVRDELRAMAVAIRATPHEDNPASEAPPPLSASEPETSAAASPRQGGDVDAAGGWRGGGGLGS